MSDLITARSPFKCPECHIAWEDWKSSSLRRWPRNGGDWVWRELKHFPTIGCIPRLCPNCGNNPRNAQKVASGICE